jgi:sphingolipid 4-desaturase/C4-monooxygenase
MCKATTKGAAPAASENPMVHPEKQPHVNAYEAPSEFHWVGTDEPHATRRKLILAKYPQIKELFGHDWRTKYVVTAVVALQTYCAFLAPTLSWPKYIALAYLIGGTSNHAMMLAMHELSHNLGFKRILYNRIFSIFANLPIGVPSSVSFKRYHMEHHRYQGEDGVDVDLPTTWEGKIFNNTLTKLFFVFFQVLFYSFRPMIVNPKTPGLWEAYNWMACVAYNYFIYMAAGPWGLFYLLFGSLLGSGLHPVAGHFIAEHYVFILGYETYSYYGILNWLTFNVGLHNEHHDFPYVPGSRLHRVREIAPEFYENLPQHKSWTWVLVQYIFNPNIGAFSRVKRKTLSEEEKNKMKTD